MRNSFAPPSSAPRLQLDLLRTTVLKHFQSLMSESHVDSTGLGESFAALLKMFLQSPTVFVSSSFKLHPEKHHECERKTRFLFTELDQAEAYSKDGCDSVRGLLGGKGANLADMTRLGVPVPPGLTVTTESCNAFLEAGEEFPEGMWDQVLEGLKAVEAQMGRKFGDLQDPLLVSCRSCAKFSMPGMMDTVLNIGLNDAVAEQMILQTSERFVFDLYRRLIQMFGSVVMDVPDEVFEAVIEAQRKVA